MLVEFEFRGDICVLRLQGRFATGQDSLYLHTKAEELKTSGCAKILVDFSDVDYVDSTGIGFLIGIYGHLAKNRTLILIGILIVGLISAYFVFVVGKVT